MIFIVSLNDVFWRSVGTHLDWFFIW
uniref:Uncharacterized protein n=1 Tax=Rhizophora mucronata TaxID=61149 RepID=A0A2P2QEL7_RHIMU